MIIVCPPNSYPYIHWLLDLEYILLLDYLLLEQGYTYGIETNHGVTLGKLKTNLLIIM